MYVIGTAGHVDHGKSTLVQALTGIDPDRLREEKERGMTIDLGFAWLKLSGGQEVSIVDVPGHERFIKNMLAGVGGIDLALLIIAADEGVMPQTEEHLAILDLLQVRSGVLVITKADLVDEEWLALVEDDVQKAVKGTSLEGSPLVTCSAVTGEGLDRLLQTIEAKLATTPPKRDIGRPRLPIDRVFTISGFGTVVTGTLIDGSLAVGQEVEIVPGGRRSRIRGLQTHRTKVERVQPGRRVAANLAGVATTDLHRGLVVTTPGWLQPTVAVDVRLRTVRGLSHPLRHNTQVTFHTGSTEVVGRVRLLDHEELLAGEEGWAQVRLQEPVAVIKGDFFVLRTPNETVGGGQIVETHAKRHRRFHAATLAGLRALEQGGPEETLLSLLARQEPAELQHLLPRLDLTLEQLLEIAQRLVREGRVIALDGGPLTGSTIVFTSSGFTALTARARDLVAAYHKQFPLRRGIAKEELRSRLGLSPRVFAEVSAHWQAEGVVLEAGGLLALPGFEPQPSPAQKAAIEAFLQRLDNSPYAPPTDQLPDAEILTYLEESGRVVRLNEIVFSRSAYEEMVRRTVEHLQAQGTITLAQVRDLFGTSRKYAQALLEHLDERRVTRRVGDERVLRTVPVVSRPGEEP